MMYRKFFACSFDDGLEQDRRIIETLKEFKMGGTFHLSSGLFGKKFWSMIPISIVAAIATFAAVQEGHYIRTKQVF